MLEEKTLKKDLISVVMSNYNTPIKYLKESIDSVLNQSYSNFEFIIIDDGSTDDSLAFIKTYVDPRIRLIVNEENIGLTKSLNKGLELAQGEYIARMDADDICYLDRFKKQIEYMREHHNTVVCSAWAKKIDNNNNYIEDWSFKPIEDIEIYKIGFLFDWHPGLVHPNLFFNNKLLLNNSIKYNEKYKYAQDYRIIMDCVKYGNFDFIQDFLLKYRVHDKSITQSKKAAQDKCVYRIIQEQLDSLHLSLTENLFYSHRNYFRKHDVYNSRLKKWIKQIIRANKKYKIYNQKKLKSLLWNRFAMVCYDEFSRSNIFNILSIFLFLPMRCKIKLFSIRFEYKKNKDQ